MKIETIFEDERWIAFQKPSGVLSIPDRFNSELPNLYTEVNKKFGKLWMVHRLDKDTSGLIIFARDEEAHRHLSLLFQERKVGKYYLAIVQGCPLERAGSIRAAIAPHPTQKGRMHLLKSGKPAHTDYETVQQWRNYSLLKLRLHTGRTHQIRVHLQSIGNPVVGDGFYGSGEALFLSSFKKRFKLSVADEAERPLIGRLALHAFRLVFEDLSGKPVAIEAPLPKDMQVVIRQLSKWNPVTEFPSRY